MKEKRFDTRSMVLLAMLSGVLVMMQATGIGMIPLPAFKLTILHIPVILGAILLGPGSGAFLGLVFGLCSVWANTTAPNPLTSMFFSPFMTMTGAVGAVKALWVSVGCRMLFGLVSGLLWRLLRKLGTKDYLGLPITGAVSTVLHTALVLGSICLLFPNEYAQVNKTTVDALFAIVGTTIATNGIIEATVAAILTTIIGKALLHFMERTKRRQ